jgi:hypothetical protein
MSGPKSAVEALRLQREAEAAERARRRPATAIARVVSVQVRMTPAEEHMLNRIGRTMVGRYSDVLKMDGSVNHSAVIRHLIQEANARE